MEWKEIEIGTLVTLRQGFAINKKSKHYLSEEKTDLYLLRIADMRDRSFSVYIDDTIPQQFIANKQDIIYSRTGQVGLVFTDLYGVVHNNCFTVTPIDENTLHRNYLLYVLKSDSFYRKANSLASGSAQPDLSHSAFKSITIPLPPIPMQKRIANILSSLDAKIENNNKINANLEAQAAALFKSWFVDFEPFKDGEFVESELGMIPKGWKVGYLDQIIDLCPGGTPKTSNALFWENGTIPFFSPKDVSGTYCFCTEKSITSTGLNNCSSRLYNKNTIFITCRGTVGKVTLAAVPMAMNQSNYAIIGKDNFTQEYLFFLTKSLVEKLIKKSNGAVFSAITTKDFHEQIIIPSSDTISRFTCIVKCFFDQIWTNDAENQRLSSLRDTLLPKLMSGEIDLDNIKL